MVSVSREEPSRVLQEVPGLLAHCGLLGVEGSSTLCRPGAGFSTLGQVWLNCYPTCICLLLGLQAKMVQCLPSKPLAQAPHTVGPVLCGFPHLSPGRHLSHPAFSWLLFGLSFLLNLSPVPLTHAEKEEEKRKCVSCQGLSSPEVVEGSYLVAVSGRSDFGMLMLVCFSEAGGVA